MTLVASHRADVDRGRQGVARPGSRRGHQGRARPGDRGCRSRPPRRDRRPRRPLRRPARVRHRGTARRARRRPEPDEPGRGRPGRRRPRRLPRRARREAEHRDRIRRPQELRASSRSDTAELMAGAGVRAILLPRLLPTPVLAFAVRDLEVGAGVMVTASHNPANDNGYKVYLGGLDHGSQIVPPVDALIADEIARVAAGWPGCRPAPFDRVRDRRRLGRRRVRARDGAAGRQGEQAAGLRLHADARGRAGRPRSACSPTPASTSRTS